ncbi:MAG: RNA 2',3'-cyclic phosphodiesterase [Candidatus Micrarchaeota archaeon]|nr:RNA 2',3'-cyclic phosphodiesterase [Candidatus Micrarchaeota archaeon]
MRVFVAIPVPPKAREEVRKACACLQDALGARMVDPKNYHFTLKFIGEAGEEEARRIEAALEKIEFEPFEIVVENAGAFPSARVPRAIWLGGHSDGAAQLAQKVEEALSFLNLPKEKFRLHLTVARSKGIADIEEFLKTGRVCSFEAGSFALMKSTLAAHGAIYETLREFPAQREA